MVMSTDPYALLSSEITADAAAHLAALSGLRAEHAQALDQLSAARAALQEADDALQATDLSISSLRVEVIRLEALVETQAAEIKRLNEITNPPPLYVRKLDYHYARPGGGGGNAIETMDDGTPLPPFVVGLDVGAGLRFASGSWEGEKWNAGLGGTRHIASITIDPTNGEAILHGGAPGAQEGVYVLDALGLDWNGPLAGSLSAFVNSQNSYGEPGSTDPLKWPFGYGAWDQRSTGRLTWRRANGDLVTGQFGYAKPGRGGVCVLSNGVKRIIPGTEKWAVRAVQQLTDATYYVGVEKARVSNTALPTPGGLWYVELDTNRIERDTAYPDTPEHVDADARDTVVACRNAGIWRNGLDITGALKRDSEWYAVALRTDGAIVAACMNPALFQGRYWSVVVLDPGATTWRNITPPPLADKFDAQETLNGAPPFAAVNRGNTLGMSGATVTDVAWRGDVPVCFAAGVVYGAPDGIMQPAPGDWITVRRAYDRTGDGYEAFATSDFNAQARKPGGEWVNVGFAGGNDGADVSWVGHVLHYRGPGGERQAWNADTGAFLAATGTMPPKNPQAAMPDDVRASILQGTDVQHFGERYGTWALDVETLLIWGHGSAVSRMVPA